MIVSEFISKYIKKKRVKEIFMLTGYGSMYLNDSIKKEKIKYYATRNEATAPIMAAAYGRVSNNIGVACVTAGPGATNAMPGLSEAYVDSSPVVIISGQVELKHTTLSTKSSKIRTFGTAEINIEKIVKNLTKYAKTVTNENDIRYILDKAFFLAKNGRPGPVWIDVPLDIQKKKIVLNKLKKFSIKKKKIKPSINFKIIENLLKKSKKPLIVCGQGVRFSKTFAQIYKNISLKYNIPIMFSRGCQDEISHTKKLILGLGGVKGSKFCKDIMTKSDLVLSFGCRMAPQFVGHEFEAFKNAKVISVDIEKDELSKKGINIHARFNYDLKVFIPLLVKFLKNKKFVNFLSWSEYCEKQKVKKIAYSEIKKNPIDLYYFMKKLGDISSQKHILVTDAGSNYYIGGQVWKFEKGQKEITSITNAAMGLTVPLAIGSAIGDKKKQVLAVTGDGSIELNIQELKTMSHYKLNIKLFVINNGGYVSMHNWADSFFDGRRVDNPSDTGEGTLNFKKIANAFGLKHTRIFDYNKINIDLKKILNNNLPMLIEVCTNNRQKIFDAFKDQG